MAILATTVSQPMATASQRLRAEMRRRLEFIGRDPGRVALRLKELDREWDLDRAVAAHASGIALIGLALGAAVHRRFLVIPLLTCGALLWFACAGRCPPLAALRGLGLRTREEIEDERRELLRRRERR